MLQLMLHLVGDYVTQSHWMATRKTVSSFAAGIHAAIYALPFLFLGSVLAVVLIGLSHFIVDRWRLARYLVFAKNFMGWPWPKWEDCKATGYPSDCPAWMAVWLMIIADNTIHLACNYAALKYLP
jgi:hypothetical protein